MKLKIVDSLSAPGKPDVPNDDAWSSAPGFVAVLDGATGLGGKLLDAPSDAAWVAQLGAARLAHHSTEVRGRAVLARALADVEAAFLAERVRAPQARYELPMASMITVQIASADTLAALWFGDCGILVKRPNSPIEIIGHGFEQRSGEGARAAQLAAAAGVSPAQGRVRSEFLADLRASRNRYNTGEGPWVFAPDAAAADHAQAAAFPAPPGTRLLLATDGFLALTTDYGRYTAESLMDAVTWKGLDALLVELRAIEDADPGGDRFPRFKKSDDATAVLVEVI